MKENMLGIDVGGTKCAIIYGIKENDELHIIVKLLSTPHFYEIFHSFCLYGLRSEYKIIQFGGNFTKK